MVLLAQSLSPRSFENPQSNLGAAMIAAAGALAIKMVDQFRDVIAGDKEGAGLRRQNNSEMMIRLRDTIRSLDILVTTVPGDARLPAAAAAFKTLGEFLTHWDKVRFELPQHSRPAWRDIKTLVSKLYLALDLDGELKSHPAVTSYLADTKARLAEIELQHDSE